MENRRQMDGTVSNVLVLRTNGDEFFYERLLQLLGDDYPLMTCNSDMSEFMKIIEYELCVNQLLYQYIERNNVDQINWFGKDKQHILYNIDGY